MDITTDPNLWVICALVFFLGMLVGIFLTAGGRRKWKTRYNTEVERRRELERTQEEREKHWATPGKGMARARQPARRRGQGPQRRSGHRR